MYTHIHTKIPRVSLTRNTARKFHFYIYLRWASVLQEEGDTIIEIDALLYSKQTDTYRRNTFFWTTAEM